MKNENKTMKEQFEKIVLSALSELDDNYKACFSSICNQKIFVEVIQDWYYKGHYWFSLKLKEEQKKNDDYDDVVALHIKPYRITTEDIKSAKKRSSGKGKMFCMQDSGYVDYDPKSANFHKNVDEGNSELDIQVVLISKNTNPQGPGWKNSLEKESYNVESPLQKGRNYVKTDWYFPSINAEVCSDNNEKSSMKKCETKAPIERLKDALKTQVMVALNTVCDMRAE